ncbi:clathrin-adaptor gamma chain [Heterostelium album PN500]|uniref:AP-1 complex subunit gamma n=1 Tax=Heterostelium pallidum (strain ATCC 26659 / Pp 5 / PN500) TaxID=670386 RepID=D3AZW1_HETP5|nr:clathrin-adaptor gamma chain [Heterostelium album PN500]EFA84585.1 clathrin-adaptor gamma chain [Heterostelium album PN500]|eukprot:XP_020436698.1 clathrin-adaptor gamma chain [Heterostelium album PN500]
MSIKLRDLIKTVRGCKTAAEERAQVAKECAAIRTAIKEDDIDSRQRNVAKLLYIHMLGYPTQFGQMECLKLIVSPSYSDKRIGYLGLMLLLDEKQEVLLLGTNCMRNDLLSPNQFVVGISLCALGNVCSQAMARDIAPDVEKLLSNTNPYIRKKAALCAIRILRKVPDLIENYMPKIKQLLSERNHGVILTALTLIIEMVPQFVRILKTLVHSGYLPEHDVSGITDPFLQVKLLRLLRILGQHDPEASDTMNDMLAQVATNTEGSKNVGNAILYECVQTIMSIDSENGLKVMAINILGRFLLNRDNNIRYVALNTLSKVVNTDIQAVQRHRNTIVECLKDPDVSIRCRALDLIYSLVNETNIRVLVRELLNFLLISDSQFKPELVAKLCIVTEKYAPTKRWQVDTILRVMLIAGNFIPDEVPSNLIQLISSNPDLSSYAVQKLYLSLVSESSQQPLCQVGLWCIGEYGDLLVADKSQLPKEEDGLAITVSEAQVIDLIDSILKNASTNQTTRQYALTSLIKLSSRFSQSSLNRIKNMIDNFKININLELQQRACEYSSLFGLDLKSSILDRMPAIEKPEESPAQKAQPHQQNNNHNHQSISNNNHQQQQQQEPFGTLLSELNSPSTPVPTQNQQQQQSTMSLLEDIFGAPPTPQSNNSNQQQPMRSPPTNSNNNGGYGGASLLDLMGDTLSPTSSSSPAPLSAAPQSLVFPVYQKHGLNISYDCSKPNADQVNLTQVVMLVTNTLASPITNLSVKAAVPQYLKIQLLPPSGTTVPPNNSGEVTQIVKVLNTLQGQKPILLRLKLDFTVNGENISEIADTPLPSQF